MDTYRKLYFPGRIKIRILNRESLPAQHHFLHKHPFAYHERVHLKELFWSSDGNQCPLINVLSTWRLKILSVTGVKIHLKTSQIGWPCTCKAWNPHSLVDDMRAEYVNQFRKTARASNEEQTLGTVNGKESGYASTNIGFKTGAGRCVIFTGYAGRGRCIQYTTCRRTSKGSFAKNNINAFKSAGVRGLSNILQRSISLCKGHILVPNKNMQSGSLTNICALYITWECLHQLSPNRSTHSGRPWKSLLITFRRNTFRMILARVRGTVLQRSAVQESEFT